MLRADAPPRHLCFPERPIARPLRTRERRTLFDPLHPLSPGPYRRQPALLSRPGSVRTSPGTRREWRLAAAPPAERAESSYVWMIPVIELISVLDAVRLENVGESHDTEHDATVGAAHNRKNLVPVVAHPRERAAQRLIVVHVRHVHGALAGRSFRNLHQTLDRHLIAAL